MMLIRPFAHLWKNDFIDRILARLFFHFSTFFKSEKASHRIPKVTGPRWEIFLVSVNIHLLI